ncbi:MAG: hypothetical protein GW893_12560 [Armatimonadetes bacterium]|nr:hypothetical protein [Armatimonadota bacterium]
MLIYVPSIVKNVLKKTKEADTRSWKCAKCGKTGHPGETTTGNVVRVRCPSCGHVESYP